MTDAERAQYVSQNYGKGCNCAQMVLTAFCEELGLKKDLAVKIACPFGGGMGHTGGVCGAVSGALMVIGLKYGPESPENPKIGEIKIKNYKIAQDFISRFKDRCGSVYCTELLEYDLRDESQLKLAKQAGVFDTKCRQYVTIAVQILEELMSEYDTHPVVRNFS